MVNLPGLIFLLGSGFTCFILLRFYIETKIVDYILYSVTFMIVFIRSLVLLIFDMSTDTPYIGNQDKSIFIFIQKFMFFFGPLASLSVFLIAYRSRWDHRKAILYFAIFWCLCLQILALFLKFQTNTLSFEVLGIRIYSANEANDQVVYTNFFGFLYGQGYQSIYTAFKAFSSGCLIYALLKSDNSLHYEHHDRIRAIWIFTMSLYFVSEIILLIENVTETFRPTGLDLLLQVLVALIFIIVGIKYPEGMILSRAQIVRVLRLMKEIDFDFGENKGKAKSKLLEYIEYLSSKETELGLTK